MTAINSSHLDSIKKLENNVKIGNNEIKNDCQMSNPFIGPKCWIWSNILGMGKGNKQTGNKF